MKTYRRRYASDTTGLATHTINGGAVALSSIAAIWQAGNAGPVTFTVDGRQLGRLDGGAAGVAMLRFDRQERIEDRQTIEVTMPTSGMVELQGERPA